MTEQKLREKIDTLIEFSFKLALLIALSGLILCLLGSVGFLITKVLK